MPPKAKFTKEQITKAALELVREQGADALTARVLGKALGSSSCPIFTVFKDMEEVRGSVIQAAKILYKEYVNRGLSETPAFKGVGTQYILFAVNEPNLFRLLFMTEQNTVPNFDGILPMIDESYEQILASIVTGYGIDRAAANRLYRHLWIYTHGIAAMCVSKLCSFTPEEISGMMTDVFKSLLKTIKEEQSND